LQQGQTVRFYITSVANVRPFNLSIPGAQLKLVGGDIGRMEQERYVDSIIIGPAERYIVEARFSTPGRYEVRNVNLWAQYTLGTIRVVQNETRTAGLQLRSNPDIASDVERYRKYFDKRIDKELILTIALNNRMGMMGGEMHSTTNIEWEDTMEMMNRRFSSKDVRWIIRDKSTGAENDAINYSFNKGEVVKIRITNEAEDSEHPMQHSIHLHGQRFLVLNQDGIPSNDLVWKDTVLVPTGSYVDILLDANNPGNWMMHCHIAEHLEASMMGYFTVNDPQSTIELT
jgi:FtsP/CotA-like multicopper oxidase with cupredoxin domain